MLVTSCYVRIQKNYYALKEKYKTLKYREDSRISLGQFYYIFISWRVGLYCPYLYELPKNDIVRLVALSVNQHIRSAKLDIIQFV